MRAGLLLSALLGFVLLANACLEEEPVETQDIVSTIPWPDQERAEYIVVTRDGEERLGGYSLEVSRQDDTFELSLQFEGRLGDREGTDAAVVLVDAETLKPRSVHREEMANEEEQRIDAEYDPAAEVVNITEDGERLVPLRLDYEHYYDNDSSLFIWRTIAFAEEYRADYHTVITGSRDAQLVHLFVRRKETITVPAGTFETWRLEISAGRVRQVAWYADTPERPLVQYDNTIQLFQLERVSAP
jgi:hypothetical protein